MANDRVLLSEIERDDEDYQRGNRVNDKHCDWAEVPMDVLCLIAHRLHLVDRIMMSRVCRFWRRIMLSGRLYPYEGLRYGLPCLVYTRDSSCHLFDPIHTVKHIVEIPSISSSTKVLWSEGGWLLLSQCHRTDDDDILSSMFFLNPLSKARIELPSLKEREFGLFSFSDRPTSSSCVVVGFMRALCTDISIRLWRPGDAQWTFIELFTDEIFHGLITRPTWYSGSTYCLDTKGNLGIFDPREETWTHVERQVDLGPMTNNRRRQYLVESGGNLLRVCDLGDSVAAFKWDALARKWLPLKSLVDTALFLGEQDCTSVPALAKSMQGQIYFNKFRRRREVSEIVTCSLGKTTNRPLVGFEKLEEFLFSSWLELEWSQPSLDQLD